MLALNKKLLRELWHLKGQVVSIALVVASGIMSVVTMRGSYESLVYAQQQYYSETRFADVAAAYGFDAIRVEDPAALSDVLGGAGDGPTLIEVVTSVWETPIDSHRRALEQDEHADY